MQPMSEADDASCFKLADDAVRWLVSIDRTAQWGDTTYSDDPVKKARLNRTISESEVGWFAEVCTLYMHKYVSLMHNSGCRNWPGCWCPSRQLVRSLLRAGMACHRARTLHSRSS